MSGADVSLNLNSREEQFRAVARVFFTPGIGRPVEMRGLPLQNHLDNVAHLASLWDFNRAFGFKQCPPGTKETRFWLVEAARRHDEGKIRRFHIHFDEKNNRYTYSFSGHRFEVSDERLYVQWLIRLHHGFSVNDVTEAQAYLKQSGDSVLVESADHFPLDLYSLEMCDQIEAEAASRAFGNVGQPRVFMEFEIEDIPGDKDTIVRMGLFPYPFAEPEVHFTLNSFVVSVPEYLKLEDNVLKQHLLKQGTVIREEQKEVQLCRME